MPINHSFSILMCNTKLVLKLTILILIIGLLLFSLIAGAIMPIVKDFASIIRDSNIDADQFINHPIQTVRTEIIDECINYLKTTKWETTLIYIILLLYALSFLFTLSKLPVTKVLYNKMISGYDIGLLHEFISTSFQNLLLSFILSIISFSISIGLLIGAWSLISLCLDADLLVLIPFVIILCLSVLSVRSCIFSQWIPEICASDSKNIFVSLKTAFNGSAKRFAKNYLCYFTINFILFAVIISTVVLSFGSIPLMCIPIYIVLSCALSLTLNFSYHQQKYFTDNGSTIYTPTKLF